MFSIIKRSVKNNKGITLAELVIVVPFIAIIFALAFNMLFLIQRSFRTVNASFDVAEELRIFQINIQKEANRAKKGEEVNDVLTKVNQSTIHIYTDIDGDNIPEIIRYRKDGNELKKAVKYKKSSSTVYPFSYNTNFEDEKIVLKNVTNNDIFGDVEKVRETKKGEGADHRRKVFMKLIIQNGSKTVEINTYLVTKSRTDADID